MFRRTRIKIAKKFRHNLAQDDLRGYRNILKLLYHPKAKTPLKHPVLAKYYIEVPCLHLDLIIDSEKAEIVNTKQIYPLNLDKKVLERALEVIREKVIEHREMHEQRIKHKKQNILQNLYIRIK